MRLTHWAKHYVHLWKPSEVCMQVTVYVQSMTLNKVKISTYPILDEKYQTLKWGVFFFFGEGGGGDEGGGQRKRPG